MPQRECAGKEYDGYAERQGHERAEYAARRLHRGVAGEEIAVIAGKKQIIVHVAQVPYEVVYAAHAANKADYQRYYNRPAPVAPELIPGYTAKFACSKHNKKTS